MSSATFSLLFVSLSLFSFRGSSAVKCTADGYNPCRCILSDGYRGSVDLTPIFKNGPIDVNQKSTYSYFPRLNRCSDQYRVELIHYSEGNIYRTFGGVANQMKEWTVSLFTPDQNFEFVVEYSGSREYYPLEVTYTYEPTTEHSMDVLNYGTAFTQPANGLKLQVKSKYVKPVLLAESDAVGGPVEDDVCAGWERQRTPFAELGLLNLAASVIVLNSTNVLSHSEYHLGVCVSPVKDTKLDESCLAVRRIRRSPDVTVEDLCIGRGLLSQLVDHRDQGWMLLRYSFGDYIDDCKGYAVTEILFTCDHRDQAASLPMYPENDFFVQCRYQFIWSTHLACPNLTSPSGGSPSSLNPSSILLGMSGSVLVLLLLVTVGVTVSTCFLYRARKRHSVNLSEPITETTPAPSVPGDSGELLVNEERLYEEEQKEMDD